MTTEQENNNWKVFIEPFAKAISKSTDEVTTALKPVVGEPGDEAIELLANDEFAPLSELAASFKDVPAARLKKGSRRSPSEEAATDRDAHGTYGELVRSTPAGSR
jgi:hypothetical protein